MGSYKLLVFHVLAWFESAFALFTYHYYIEQFRQRTYGGHWKFLTYINLHIQFLCFSLCVLTDILYYVNLQNLATKLHTFKDFFYATVGLPSCLAVFVTFWTLYGINRDLVYPTYLDNFLPTWTNHVWHTAILITVVEVICDHHQYPKRSFGLSLCSAFGIGYLLWVEWVYRQSGISIYPFLKELQGRWYFLFVLIEMLFSWLTYLIGEFLNSNFGKTSNSWKENTISSPTFTLSPPSKVRKEKKKA